MPELLEEFKAKVERGEIQPLRFFRQFDDDTKELRKVARWAISNLEYQEHRMVVTQAFVYLAHRRDLYALPYLRRLNDSWRNIYIHQYEYLIALLENVERGGTCNCVVYSKRLFNVPPFQEDIEIIESHFDNNQNIEIVKAQCKICKRLWTVRIDHRPFAPHSIWEYV